MSSENERDDDRKREERPRSNRAGGDSRPQRPASGGSRGGNSYGSGPRNSDSRPRSSSSRGYDSRGSDSRGSYSRNSDSRGSDPRGEGPRGGGQRGGYSRDGGPGGRDGSRSSTGGPRGDGARSSGPRSGGGRYDNNRSDGGSRSGGSWGRGGRSDERSDSRGRSSDGRGRTDSGPRAGGRGDSERRSSGGYGRTSDTRSGEYRGGGDRRGPASGGEFRGRGPARDGRAGGGRPGSGGRPDSRDGGSYGGRTRDTVRRDDRRNEREDGSRRGDRSGPRVYIDAPEVPEDIHISQLDKEVRQRLRTLSKDNAEDVGRHLVMAGALIEIDPELAYKHAQVAVARGGRVDVVREAGALTAYATGRYAEALRELRTVRRLSGSNEHLPLMADCERGLGRPERAIDLARSSDAATLGHRGSVEMEIVAAGARLDLGQSEAAYVALKRIETKEAALQTRIDTAMVAVLRAMGREEQATALEATLEDLSTASDDTEIEYDITVYDVAELPIPEDDEVSDDDAFDDEAIKDATEEVADEDRAAVAHEPASDSAEEETK